MTKVIKQDLYCKKCKKIFNQPVYMSVSSFLMSEDEKKRMAEGTLFKNFCPECGSELVLPPKEGEK